MRIITCLGGLLIAASLLGATPAFSQSDAEIRTEDTLSLPLFKSGILNLERPPSQISIGNPGIADILILRGTQVHVVAKALGSTNVVFWDRSDRIFATVDIEVTHDLDSLKQKLFTLLPNEDIGVHSSQEKLVLKGTVSSAANLRAAMDIADSFLPECIPASSSSTDVSGKIVNTGAKDTNAEGCEKAEVVNLMNIGGAQQVMLEVKIAEISRTFMRTLDSDLSIINMNDSARGGLFSGGAEFPPALIGNQETLFQPFGSLDGAQNPVGPTVDLIDPATGSIADTGLFFADLFGSTYVQLALDVARQKGLSKILAEPNLTTLTGKPAKFVSGGEFPISVVSDDGVEIIYKEFGVLVNFLPTILDNSRISLDLGLEVSDLRLNDLINGYPIIDKRGASSTVELKNGQTIGIAGLIQDDLTETFSRLPGLGDIPILGTLFRSQAYQSGQTELVMFVTPHLAQPIASELIKLPTDSFVAPNDFEFYVLGEMEGTKDPEPVFHGKTLDGGFDGVTFGHTL